MLDKVCKFHFRKWLEPAVVEIAALYICLRRIWPGERSKSSDQTFEICHIEVMFTIWLLRKSLLYKQNLPCNVFEKFECHPQVVISKKCLTTIVLRCG